MSHLPAQPDGDADPALTAEYRRLQVLTDLGRWADVVQQAAALRAAGDAEAWLFTLDALNGQRDWPRLRSLALQALARWPQDPRLHLLAALGCIGLGLLQQAAALLQQGLALAPTMPALLRQRARVAMLQGDAVAAQRSLAQAQALEPDNPQQHLLLAGTHVMLGQQARAQQAARAALQLAPDDAQALSLMGLLQRRRSRGRALNLARRALRQAPGDADLQRDVSDLQRAWWWDHAAAVLVVLATGLANWHAGWGWGWAGGQAFVLGALACLVVGVRLQRYGQPASLAGFCLAMALAGSLRTPGALPTIWRERGWAALAAGDLLAFVLGHALLALLLAVVLVLARHVAWHGLLQGMAALRAAWQAQRRGLLPAHTRELLGRRHVQVNALVVAAVVLPLLPPWPPAMAMLWVVFGLPAWAWGCSRWRQPAQGRIAPSLAFMLLGFPIMLALVLAFGWVSGSAPRQVLVALGLGLYALLVTHQLQRM